MSSRRSFAVVASTSTSLQRRRRNFSCGYLMVSSRLFRKWIPVRSQLQLVRPVRTSGTLEQLRLLHASHVAATHEEIQRQLRGLPPAQFETFARHLLVAYGFRDVVVTRAEQRRMGSTGNGKLPVGMAHLRAAFQCKSWRGTSWGDLRWIVSEARFRGDFEQGHHDYNVNVLARGAKVFVYSRCSADRPLGCAGDCKGCHRETHRCREIEFLPLFLFSIDVLLDDGPH